MDGAIKPMLMLELVGVIMQAMIIIGMLAIMTMEEHLLQDHKSQKEAEAVEEQEVELMDLLEVAQEEAASSVVRKATCQEIAITSRLAEEEEVLLVGATEVASDAERRVTWPKTVLIQIQEAVVKAEEEVAHLETEDASNVEKKDTWQENVPILETQVEIEVAVEEEEVEVLAHQLATNAIRKATLPENARMMETKDRDPTRGRGEMMEAQSEEKTTMGPMMMQLTMAGTPQVMVDGDKTRTGRHQRTPMKRTQLGVSEKLLINEFDFNLQK